MLLAALVPLSLVTTPLVLGIAATAALIVVAAWETISLRRGNTARTQEPGEIG